MRIVRTNFLIQFGCMLICGATWNVWPGIAAILTLLMPAIVVQNRQPRLRWLLAFIWFLAGSVSIVPSAAGFFGAHALLFGVGAWMLSAAILALPWIAARSATGAVLAILLDAVPPIGIIDWLSPLSSAGWLFPDQGFAGIAGCLLVVALVTAAADPHNGCRQYRVYVAAIVMAVWSAVANLVYVPPAVPTGWIGVQTSIPPSHGNVFQSIANNRNLIAAAQSHAGHATFLVFPEAVLDDWWLGTRTQLAGAVPRKQTWILGAETQSAGGHWDALVAVCNHQPVIEPLFRAALPMPISMWRPGFGGGVDATWHEPMQKIGGRRTWANICFDQVLPWVWIDGMMQHPDLVLLPSNIWWAQPWNPAPIIQRIEARAWIRLMGVPAIFARNQTLTGSHFF